MILAPLTAAAFLVTVATAPHANPTLLPALSMQQRSAVQPLMRSATECIARTVSSHPRFGKPNADLGDLIVDSMPHCAIQVHTMIEAYDRYSGDGEGEVFPLSRPAPERSQQMGQRLRALTGGCTQKQPHRKRSASAGLSTSESGSVSSTIAATTTKVVGTPSKSPSTPYIAGASAPAPIVPV